MANVLDILGSDEFLLNFTRQIGFKAAELIKDEFNTSRDPYQNSWTPVKKKKQGHKILVDTAALMNGFNIINDIDGVTITNSIPYAGYHQYGTQNIPVRMMLPESDGGLPEKWNIEFQTIFNDLITEAVK